MAEENKMKRFPVSMQPDIEDLLKEISRQILHLRRRRSGMILFRSARVCLTGRMPGGG